MCSGRQPFPAGDRVTFNGKECICEKCTQPVPVNSTAPPQAVYSKFSVFLHCYLFSLYVTCTLLPIHFLNVCNDSPLWRFISTTFVSLSLQIAVAVERSLKMSSLWWRWTSTGTLAASSAKCAIKCLMPNISAS